MAYYTPINVHRKRTINQITQPPPPTRRSTRQKFGILLGVPILAILGTMINFLFLNLNELGFGIGAGMEEESMLSDFRKISSKARTNQQQRRQSTVEGEVVQAEVPVILSSSSNVNEQIKRDWCEQVAKARADLSPFLQIHYPCEKLQPATSAVVCMLTDGAAEGKDSKFFFTARDYINGIMTLGASLQGNIDPTQTHQLLLLRDGFELQPDDRIRLASVGWVIGTAPNFPLAREYVPRFPRYKTTYTKITAIGLGEYKCVMLMDADTLVIGNIQEIMKCNVFQHPNNRVAGTIDWYQKHWHLFNTGSILWKPSGKEMDRVFNLTKNTTFMKKYSSDQDFLNHVYPERLNNTLNSEIVTMDTPESRRDNSPLIPHEFAMQGSVVPMSWEYNAQTHAEVENMDFWKAHRDTVRILHFTEKKGWRCERRYDDPPPLKEMPNPCLKEIPICFCREAHLYWKLFDLAETIANETLALAKG
ncbi:hypothetical protein IV203_008114 [Nitzschia inconspicua]|uniref:Hexosyltransferase n=1 Tax=Nitzschia inconspicua TaxID=303405 RepID=A0A9K3KZM1_9STRA|nr:hypothetical protein IV203_008114 [Nitzschia inconspicua]